ncbi:tigger transposable element-derived protein 3-like [Columba livia]|uniref:tigger transposable element-derived protein 3-like n=1 Tax=Columba livia TaxID=8932 RepID=UPI0031B9CBA1
MKEDRDHPVALGLAVTKPDILAEVERGEAAAGGPCGEHRRPGPHAAPAGPSQGPWPGKEVKREEGVSPPPGCPPAPLAGPGDLPGPLRGHGCTYCGTAEPGPANGGFAPLPPALESRRCRPGECAECGRGLAQKPDLVRHRRERGSERGYTCGRCGRGFGETGATGSHGRAPGLAEGGPAAAPRKERKELSLTEKVRVLEMLEGPKVSQNELAKRFGVSQPQICRIIKNRERILSEWHRHGDPERKRRREGKDAALEAALLRWVEGARAADLPGTGPLLPLTAKPLARAPRRPEPEPSSAWLPRFGACHSLACQQPPAGEEDTEQPTAERWASAVLPGLLRSYAPSEIYACGETGVVYPTGESTGDRLTLLLCANADGSEKVPLRVVGDTPRPRCLRAVNLGQMPWSYRAGSLAAVTASLFTEWLQELNEGMRRRGKSILLLLAKHEAHPYLQLSNIRMVFVPPAATLAQPLDRGITSDLKGHYRRRLLRWPPVECSTGQPTLLDVLHMLAQAWGDVHAGLITSCFRAAGISADTEALAFGHEQLDHRALMDEELERDEEQADGDEGMAEDTGEPAAVQPCPSEREVWGSLATLRRYLECRATSPELFQAFYELEDVVHMVSASAGGAPSGDTPPQQ